MWRESVEGDVREGVCGGVMVWRECVEGAVM